jgi:hypothetical protein
MLPDNTLLAVLYVKPEASSRAASTVLWLTQLENAFVTVLMSQWFGAQ